MRSSRPRLDRRDVSGDLGALAVADRGVELRVQLEQPTFERDYERTIGPNVRALKLVFGGLDQPSQGFDLGAGSLHVVVDQGHR